MSNDLPRATFSTDFFSIHEKEEAYRDVMGVVFDVDSIEDGPERFNANMDIRLIGDLIMTDCQTGAQNFTRSKSKIAKDSMDHILVQVFLDGSSNTENENYNKDKLLVIDSSRPWEAYNTDFRNLTLVVPRRLLNGKLWDEDAHHGRALDIKHNPMAELFRSHLLSLHRNIDSMENDLAHSLVAPTTDLLVAALNNASKNEGKKPIDTNNELFLLIKIKKFIEENLTNLNLSSELIQVSFNLTRPSLYRLFSNTSGVMNYIRERRLKRAFKLLVGLPGAQPPISELALQFGFSDHSSFTRAFRNYFGISPRDVKNGVRIDDKKSLERSDHLWSSWILGL